MYESPVNVHVEVLSRVSATSVEVPLPVTAPSKLLPFASVIESDEILSM